MSTTKKAFQAVIALAFIVAMFALAVGDEADDWEFKLSQTRVATPDPGSSTPSDPDAVIQLNAPERPQYSGTIMPEPGEQAPGASFGTTAPEKYEYTGPQYTPDPNNKVGGDDCGTAVTIGGLPFNDTGNTSTFADDYDEICPYDAPGSPDVVYVFTPAVDMCVDIDLCNGSAYDTKLYVYENTCPDPGNAYACNDDACPGYVSQILGLALTGGNDYYIVIDGYGGDAGDYVLDVTEVDCPTECVVECPDGAVDEGEACGDDTNGGCNMGVPSWTTVNDGDVICGTIWAADGTRDTDWFEVYIGTPRSLTWTCEAEFPVVIGYITGCDDGVPDCSCITQLDPYTTGGCNEVISVTYEASAPGYYWFFVSHQDYYDQPCGLENDYVASMEFGAEPTGRCCYDDPADPLCVDGVTYDDCVNTYSGSFAANLNCTDNPCPIIGENDDCSSPNVIPGLPYNASGNTCDFNNDYDEECPYSGSTAPDVVFEFTPAVDMCVDITLCNGSDYDTKLYVYENACPDPGNPYACNDDACPGYVSEILQLPLTGGNTYYIIVDGYGTACGNYILDMYEVDCPTECYVECPDGASDEGEPCGDDTNGGCNMGSPTWTPVTCGETICGTIWAADGTRDTDWFEVTLTGPQTMTWTCEAEFPVVIGYIAGCPDGAPDCSCITQLEPYITGDCNEVISVQYEASAPGNYWFFVSHQDYYDQPCGYANDYVATLTCDAPPTGRCCYGNPEAPDCADDTDYDYCINTLGGYLWSPGLNCTENPCPVAPDNDECVDAIEVFPPETVVGSTYGATVDCPGVLDWNAVWYKFDNPYECANVVIDACYVSPVYEVQCLGVVLYAACDDCPNYILYTGISWNADCGTPTTNPVVYHDNLVGPATYWYPLFRGDAACENIETDFSFEITMEECPPPVPGDNCGLPINVKIPADLDYYDPDSTCGRQDFVNATCLGSYDGGEDLFYELEVTATTSVTITMDPLGTTWSGMALDDACPPDPSTCLYSVTGSSSTPRVFENIILDPGLYYVMIDTWPSPTCIPALDFSITLGLQPGELVVDPTSIDFGTVNEGDNGSTLLNLENVGEQDLNFDVAISYTAPSPSEIANAFMAALGEYSAGSTMDIDFILQNASTDAEWLDACTMDFPAGVTVNTSTNYVDPNSLRYLLYDGTTGDGAFVSWADDNGGYGEIYSADFAIATINLTFDAGLSGNLTIPYTISGDDWGDPPHDISGSLTLAEADPTTSWLTVNPSSGTIGGTPMDATDLTVAYNASGLYNETFEATIIITHDGSNPTQMVPVTMTVVGGAAKVAVEPDPSYIYYQFAYDPIYHSAFVGNFNPPYTASDVASLDMHGEAATFVQIHSSYPGFTGEVAEFTFPVASMMEAMGAPLDLFTYNMAESGTFDDAQPFDVSGKMDVWGKSSVTGRWIVPDDNDNIILKGDANLSGAIDIDDAVFTISYIFSSGPAPKPLLYADANDDDLVDIDDVVATIGYIFGGQPLPWMD
jgi:hypothetical protein